MAENKKLVLVVEDEDSIAELVQQFFAITKKAQAESNMGIAISTIGKVIRRDTLGMSPRSAGRIVGLVDVPELVGCLTTSKQDFIDSGTTGTRYRKLRTQIQKAYSQ